MRAKRGPARLGGPRSRAARNLAADPPAGPDEISAARRSHAVGNAPSPAGGDVFHRRRAIRVPATGTCSRDGLQGGHQPTRARLEGARRPSIPGRRHRPARGPRSPCVRVCRSLRISSAPRAWGPRILALRPATGADTCAIHAAPRSRRDPGAHEDRRGERHTAQDGSPGPRTLTLRRRLRLSLRGVRGSARRACRGDGEVRAATARSARRAPRPGSAAAGRRWSRLPRCG